MLDRLVGDRYLFFLDGYSGYNQIAIALKIKRKPHLHVLMTPFLLEGCHLDCVILQPRIKISMIMDISVFGFYGYIGNIGGYFDKNIGKAKINKNTLKFMEILCLTIKKT